jgi:hypothetical protein
MTFGGEFRRLIRELKVLRLKPHLVSGCELVWGRSLGAQG